MTERTAPEILRGRVVTPTEVIADGIVVVHGETIAWVGHAAHAAAAGWSGIPDPSEHPVTLLPGLVDVHTHG
ncbi:MAG TPA: N-acetylglucosamine-6-phosphate deacetylase, partial [Cellulomonas sp.]